MHLLLVSLRAPDLPPSKHLVLQARYLTSFTDGSGVGFVTGSLDATDAMVLFASATVTYGASTAEFSRLARASLVGGLVWTW